MLELVRTTDNFHARFADIEARDFEHNAEKTRKKIKNLQDHLEDHKVRLEKARKQHALLKSSATAQILICAFIGLCLSASVALSYLGFDLNIRDNGIYMTIGLFGAFFFGWLGRIGTTEQIKESRAKIRMYEKDVREISRQIINLYEEEKNLIKKAENKRAFILREHSRAV